MLHEAKQTDRNAKLMLAFASGDADAFTELVQRLQAPLFRYLRSIAHDDAAAEDAMQEAFVSVWRSAQSFREQSLFKTWLFRIGRNALLRQHRRRAGEPSEKVSLDELGLAAGWGVDKDAEVLSQRIADREQLRLALEQLTIDEREILMLRDVEGFSGDEVASLLELNLAAVKSRLHRARLRLKAALRNKEDT
jgi:RNA polymerase sigma-70 factor (ECF subfamily)